MPFLFMHFFWGNSLLGIWGFGCDFCVRSNHNFTGIIQILDEVNNNNRNHSPFTGKTHIGVIFVSEH